MAELEHLALDRRASTSTAIVYERPKKTKRSVLFADAFAKYGISLGGMLVIVAVFTIMIFLIYVASPLMDAGSITDIRKYKVTTDTVAFVETQIDENQSLAVDLQLNGQVHAFHVGTGDALAAPSMDLGGQMASVFASTLRGDDVLFGFADGTVRTGTVILRNDFILDKARPPGLRKLDARDQTDGTSIYTKVPGQYRKVSVETKVENPVQVAEIGTAIVRADYRVGGTQERPLRTFVTLDAAGNLRLSQASTRLNMETGTSETELTSASIPIQVAAQDVRAQRVEDEEVGGEKVGDGRGFGGALGGGLGVAAGTRFEVGGEDMERLGEAGHGDFGLEEVAGEVGVGITPGLQLRAIKPTG